MALELSEEQRSGGHLALAVTIRSIGDSNSAGAAVAQARHLLRARPLSNWESAATQVLIATLELESLGAYRDISSLLRSGPESPAEWPDDDKALRLRVLLGRAQIRSGQTIEGCATLEGAIELARRLAVPDLFAEAVRALVEERAPQRLETAGRELIVEALEGIGDEPTECRRRRIRRPEP